MKITVEGQVYDYDPSKMLNTEAIALQKVTGMRVPEWTKALTEGDAYALTGLVWLVWRRDGREVAFDEVVFDVGSLDLQDDEVPDEPDAEPVGPTDPAPAAVEADPT